MTTLHHVKKARKTIYTEGKTVHYKSKRGKNVGKMLERVDQTQPANERDKVLIAKGEPYYWYQFAFGPRIVTCERPKPSQLTQSEFLQTYLGLQEQVEAINTEVPFEELEDIVSELEGFADEVEQLGEEQEEKRSNMPEQLQDSDSGSLLEQRASDCSDTAQSLRDAAEAIRSEEEPDNSNEDEEATVDISEHLGNIEWNAS